MQRAWQNEAVSEAASTADEVVGPEAASAGTKQYRCFALPLELIGIFYTWTTSVY